MTLLESRYRLNEWSEIREKEVWKDFIAEADKEIRKIYKEWNTLRGTVRTQLSDTTVIEESFGEQCARLQGKLAGILRILNLPAILEDRYKKELDSGQPRKRTR